MPTHEIIIKDTHRAILYKDGVIDRILDAGRYELPQEKFSWTGRRKTPRVEFVLIDVRQRDLTIKGQEILTQDKVALRVSIIVQFRVIDPRRALHEVENYEERIYSDVQLAARRSLASQTLEEILTNRNRLSEDILRDVKEVAARYGVAVLRADVKDLAFPGNLQEIMNRVLAAQRNSEAQLVEARTKADVQRLEAQSRAEAARIAAEAAADAQRRAVEDEAHAAQVRAEAEAKAVQAREAAAAVYARNPALLRQLELETLRELAGSANARIYVDFDARPRKHVEPSESIA
jgi:regulator of protease activity HflC (stomatin/prohibitin superfamily)